MRIPRFYYPNSLDIGMEITLSNSIVQHIKVIRMKIDETIILFNGYGGEYTATITQLKKNFIQVNIKTFISRNIELSYTITLAQTLLQASKMDEIIEKAVELGVAVIQPLVSQRCIVHYDNHRTKKKYDHWEKIIRAASEQSGRNSLTKIIKLNNFRDWITNKQNTEKTILLSLRGKKSLSNWASYYPPQTLTLIIGPEGGFTEIEEDLAHTNGAIILSMGERILRAETASLNAIATLNAIWEKYNNNIFIKSNKCMGTSL